MKNICLTLNVIWKDFSTKWLIIQKLVFKIDFVEKKTQKLIRTKSF
jgi:hypothetical protein